MDELNQNIAKFKLGFDLSIFCNFGGGGRIMEMVIAANIIDISRISLFHSALWLCIDTILTIRMDELIQNATGLNMYFDK